MPFDLQANLPILLLVVGVFALLAVARRIPVLRTIVSIGIWVALIASLVAVLGQRERLDPWFGQLAAAIGSDPQKVEGGETRIAMARDGHFWVRARIGGVERRMLVDSGATVTALSTDTAAAAGLEPRRSIVPILLRTANGTIPAETAELPELRMGNIVARDLTVVVSPAFGSTDILGMNFLSRLKSWRVEGRTLILQPHNPQADAV